MKNSSPCANSHTPWLEMFVTSIGEVLPPSGDELIVVHLNDPFDFEQLCAGKTVIPSQLQFGFELKLCFAILR